MKILKITYIVLKKEFKETFFNIQVLIPTLIVPFILLVLLPIIYFIFLLNTPEEIQKMDFLTPMISNKLNLKQTGFTYMLDYILPFYFMLVPIMSSSVFGSSSFVAEKEGQTIETLFYTPLRIKDLFVAKVLSVFSMAMFILVLMLAPFTVVVNFFGFKIFGRLVFPDLKWLTLIIWLAPSLIFFTISLIVWVSSWAKSFQAAQQIVGLLILPLVFIFSFYIVGKFNFDLKYVFIIGFFIFLFGLINLKFQSARWEYEKFLK